MRCLLAAIVVLACLAPSWGEATPEGLQAALAHMQTARQAVEKNQGHAQADAWFELQNATEDFGNVYTELYMNCVVADANRPVNDCPERNSLTQAKALGIELTYCQTEDRFIADLRGFNEYLKLWPQGPHADEAWWRSRIVPPCCTSRCAVQDLPSVTSQMGLIRQFAQKFPKSARIPEAQAKLAELQEKWSELKKTRQPQWGLASLQDPNRCTPLAGAEPSLILQADWDCHFGPVSHKGQRWIRALSCKKARQVVKAQWECSEQNMMAQHFQDLGDGAAVILFCTCAPAEPEAR